MVWFPPYIIVEMNAFVELYYMMTLLHGSLETALLVTIVPSGIPVGLQPPLHQILYRLQLCGTLTSSEMKKLGDLFWRKSKNGWKTRWPWQPQWNLPQPSLNRFSSWHPGNFVSFRLPGHPKHEGYHQACFWRSTSHTVQQFCCMEMAKSNLRPRKWPTFCRHLVLGLILQFHMLCFSMEEHRQPLWNRRLINTLKHHELNHNHQKPKTNGKTLSQEQRTSPFPAFKMEQYLNGCCQFFVDYMWILVIRATKLW